MKKLILLNLYLFLFAAPNLLQAATPISKETALKTAEEFMAGKDVDYYILDDTIANNWSVFIDAEPMKGWEHDCYLLTIPKVDNGNFNYDIEYRKQPPRGYYLPLKVTNRYGDAAKFKPIVRKQKTRNGINSNPYAERTYAIILSGGMEVSSNYFRYWNDCSFIYQTLVNKYDIPKNHIHLLMADGEDPSPDTNNFDGTYSSQNLDLDFDGINESISPATPVEIQNTIRTLGQELQDGDQLLFYVIDHGGSDDDGEYISLWRQPNPWVEHSRMYDYRLREMLQYYFENKLINFNFVLGQCYSGGFIEELDFPGCVVSTACMADENSWTHLYLPFDEYVFNWTSAINEAPSPIYGNPGHYVESDTDSNQRVTMLEAFRYARDSDVYLNGLTVEKEYRQERPQYNSNPPSLGEDLALNYIPPFIDLYIKDDTCDTGKEPNDYKEHSWLSPSICLNANNDSTFEHQTLTADQDSTFIKVRIHNRGRLASTGQDSLSLYWAISATDFSANVWNGNDYFLPNIGTIIDGPILTADHSSSLHNTGGFITRVAIPAIEPNDSADISVKWSTDAVSQCLTDNYHCCILACINNDPILEEFNVAGNNNQSLLNRIDVSRANLTTTIRCLVTNCSDSIGNYSLRLRPHTTEDAEFFNNGKCRLILDGAISNEWNSSGPEFENIQFATFDPNSVYFVSPQSRIFDIEMRSGFKDIIGLEFEFTQAVEQPVSYLLDLVQEDEHGNIVGGITFNVEAPLLSEQDIIINTTDSTNGINLSTNSQDFKSVRWYNNTLERISESDAVSLAPAPEPTDVHVVGFDGDGNLATNTITLEYETIKSIQKIGDQLRIEYNNNAFSEANIIITSLLESVIKDNISVNNDNNFIMVDISNYASGIYAISLIVDGKLIDFKEFNN